MKCLFKAVLFDLDGTLLDSAPDLVAALNHVRETISLPPLAVAEMSQFVSHGAVGLLNAGMPATDSATFESWRTGFLDYYAEYSFCESTLYEGVPELIDFLNVSDVPWGIVTNKIKALTLPILEASDLKDTISCVVCGDTLEKSKPDPAPVNLACKSLNVLPKNTLFVGDDIRDIDAGKAAGTHTGFIHYGYGSSDLDEKLVAGSFQIYHATELMNVVRHG